MHVVVGMIIAVFGMIWYSNASTRPGGNERRASLLPTSRHQKHSTESTEPNGRS